MSITYAICFSSNGTVDWEHSKPSGQTAEFQKEAVETRKKLPVMPNGGIYFKAHQFQVLCQGLENLGNVEVVAHVGGHGAGSNKYSAWLQRWESIDRQSRNPVFGIDHLTGFGLAKRALNYLNGQYVLRLSMAAEGTGTRVALEPRGGPDGAVKAGDGLTSATCNYLGRVLRSEAYRPDFKMPKF